IEWNLVEQALEILHGVDRHTGPPDFAVGHGMVRIVAHLSGEIERHGQPRLARREEIAEAAVRFLGGAEAGVLAHRPELAAVHGGVHATREGKLPRTTEVAPGIAGPVARAPHQLLVGHRVPRTSVANATSALLPITSGVFWCSSAGTTSRMGRLPSLAAPPACSTTNASGAASYKSRSLPCGFRASAG